MTGRVIVVGSVNVDFVVVTDRLPRPGETVIGGDIARHHGGKGGNQAVAAARMGAPVEFVGAVGSDDLGRAAADALAADGVATTCLTRLDRPTGVALIVVDGDGENLIAVAPGANAGVDVASVRAALARFAPGPADVILTVAEIPTAAVRAALEGGRKAGATTILNPAPADGLDAATLALADVVTPNRSELALIAGFTDVDARGPAAGAGDAIGTTRGLEMLARRVLGGPGGTRAAVVTLGAAGALLVPARSDAVALAPAGVRPVDATGAGDTFSGVLAASLASGLALADAARRAVVAAGISTTRAGARSGMPTRAEVEAFEAGT